jgi:DNA-binding MarR family transcriptional regulator
MRESTINAKEVDEIGNLLRQWRNFFTEFFNKVVKDTGKISGVDFSISQLKALSAFREDRMYTMGELSRNASVTMPTMTEMIDNLEKNSIVQRLRDVHDRRVVKVCLTEKGKEMRKNFMDRRRSELKNIFGKLSREDRQELMNAMEKAFNVLKKITVDHPKDSHEEK